VKGTAWESGRVGIEEHADPPFQGSAGLWEKETGKGGTPIREGTVGEGKEGGKGFIIAKPAG